MVDCPHEVGRARGVSDGRFDLFVFCSEQAFFKYQQFLSAGGDPAADKKSLFTADERRKYFHEEREERIYIEVC